MISIPGKPFLVISLSVVWVGLITISWIRILYFVRDITAARTNSDLERFSFRLKSADIEEKDFDSLYTKIENGQID
jgi:hypothetical protein